MLTKEHQALSEANIMCALQHYGSLEALERDYSFPMTQEQWNLLNALPDKAEPDKLDYLADEKTKVKVKRESILPLTNQTTLQMKKPR